MPTPRASLRRRTQLCHARHARRTGSCWSRRRRRSVAHASSSHVRHAPATAALCHVEVEQAAARRRHVASTHAWSHVSHARLRRSSYASSQPRLSRYAARALAAHRLTKSIHAARSVQPHSPKWPERRRSKISARRSRARLRSARLAYHAPHPRRSSSRATKLSALAFNLASSLAIA